MVLTRFQNRRMHTVQQVCFGVFPKSYINKAIVYYFIVVSFLQCFWNTRFPFSTRFCFDDDMSFTQHVQRHVYPFGARMSESQGPRASFQIHAVKCCLTQVSNEYGYKILSYEMKVLALKQPEQLEKKASNRQ